MTPGGGPRRRGPVVEALGHCLDRKPRGPSTAPGAQGVTARIQDALFGRQVGAGYITCCTRCASGTVGRVILTTWTRAVSEPPQTEFAGLAPGTAAEPAAVRR